MGRIQGLGTIQRLACLVLGVMISAGAAVVSSDEKTDPLPPVKEIIYSSGKDNESWFDMGQPYTKLGKVEVSPEELYPAAIYGQAADYYAHTIDLQLQLEEPLDLVLVIDFYSQEGGVQELYDLQNDPGELTNLASKPEHNQLVATWRQKLIAGSSSFSAR